MGRLFVSLALTTSLVLAVNLAVLTPTVTHAQVVDVDVVDIKTIISLVQELVEGIKSEIRTTIDEICRDDQCIPTTTTTQATSIVLMNGQCTASGSITLCNDDGCITTDLSAEEILTDGQCTLTVTSTQSTSITEQYVSGQYTSCSKTTCDDSGCWPVSCY